MAARFTTQEILSTPVLIIDPQGVFGFVLAEQLKNEFQVVYVSAQPYTSEKFHVVKYQKNRKFIPKTDYSFIIFFYSGGQDELRLLPSLQKQVRQSMGKLLIVVPLEEISQELETEIRNQAESAYILVSGELFGFFKHRLLATRLNLLLQKAAITKKILLPNYGMQSLFVASVEQTVEAIVRVMFGTYSRSLALLLFPKTPLTLLTVSRLLTQVEPLITIDFKRAKVFNRQLPKGEYVVDFADSNKQLQQTFKRISKIPNTKPPVAIKKKQKKPVAPLKKAVIKTFVVVVLLPFAMSLVCFLLGLLGAVGFVKSATSGNLTSARFSLQESSLTFSVASALANLTQFEFSTIGQGQIINAYVTQINQAQQAASALSAVTSAAMTLKNQPDNKDQFVLASEQLAQGLVQLQTLSDSNTLPEIFQSKLTGIDSIAQFVENTQPSWAKVFGYDDKQTYLVLLQNNMELRPTGGFIGSYVLLTMDKGKMINFTINDVYNADGQLKQHVEPPWQIRRYIPQVHWYMRDSNFDPDFPTSAATTANFLHLETGQQVQGVIAVDLNFVRGIISALGNVYVPEYNQTVTPQNFYLLTETQSEKNFSPGSTQKQDFLQALFAAIQRKLTNQQILSYPKLVSVVSDSLTQKDLLFAFSDKSAEALFSNNGYSDTLVDNRNLSQNTLADFLEINEANLGSNKVNYFMKRQLSLQSSVDGNGDVQDNLVINYANTSTYNWLGGAYKNYLRIIVPSGSKLTSVAINGVSQTIIPAVTDFSSYEQPGFVAPQGLEVQQSNEVGKTIFGFFININQGERKQLQVGYMLSQRVNVEAPDFFVNTKILKQPGATNDNFSYNVTSPGGYTLLSPKLPTSGNTHSISTILNKDLDFVLHFAKD